jgi:hypothetical protein
VDAHEAWWFIVAGGTASRLAKLSNGCDA